MEKEPPDSAWELLKLPNVSWRRTSVAGPLDPGPGLMPGRDVAGIVRGEVPKHLVNREVLQKKDVSQSQSRWAAVTRKELGLYKVSVMYPNQKVCHFDLEYYRSKHMLLWKSI